MQHTQRNQLITVYSALALFFPLFFLLGCGSTEDKRPQRTAVSGIVTFDGEPIEGASITFRPVEESGQTANGRSNEEGQFQMGTFEGTDGVVAGDYIVMISKIKSTSSPEVLPEDDPNYDPDPQPEPPPENLLPEKYSNAETSGLTVTVLKGEAITDLKFELSE
ncbi:carboxypeptidase-like regulatory domain-containing protein [Gimesia sp.]|uniref:carboxypeptidase-like regulatory domain-containing protein n=1 Tax=Gimesia sp. TaxID=2024833 RepID=UPI003A9544BD